MIGEEEVARAMFAAHMRRLNLPASIGLPWEEIGESEQARWIGLSRAAISAHLAALEAAGWKCVPVEATEEMLAERIGFDLWRANAREFWRRLVKVAPNGDEVKG